MEISFGSVIIILAFIGSIITYCVTSFITPKPTNSKFLPIELLRQSSAVYALTQIVGLGYHSGKIPSKISPEFVLLPIICTVSFIMTTTMGYAQTSNCEKPKRSAIYTQSLKPIVLLILTYFLVLKIGIMRGGFYDIVSNTGEHSELGMWTALGFWMAGSIWMSVTSAYFVIDQHACNSNTEITIREIGEKESPEVI
jgi:hypothetical protein